MNFALNTLNFDDIKQNIISFLQQNWNPNFDYTNQNVMFFIDALAYVTMMTNFNIAEIANELFIDSSTLRSTTVSLAKLLSYTPKRSISSVAYVPVIYNGSNFTENSVITIQPLNIFVSNSGYYWTNMTKCVLSYNNPNQLTGTLILNQGLFQTYTVPGTGQPFQNFTINDPNVDNNIFFLFVMPNSLTTPSLNYLWKPVSKFNPNFNQNIYYIDESITQEYCPIITFGDGIVGAIPQANENIVVQYLQTLGATGNNETSISIQNISNFQMSMTNDVLQQFTFKNLTFGNFLSYGGTNPESIESIKINAITNYISAGRGVTTDDYKSILSNYPTIITQYNAIGSDSLNETSGYIYITGIPNIQHNASFISNTSLYVPEFEENIILNSIKDVGVAGIIKKFVRPSYIYLDITPVVEVPNGITTAQVSQIQSNIQLAIYTFAQQSLNNFGVNYRQSQLISLLNLISNIESVKLNTNFYLTLSQDIFYKTKNTELYLPVVYKLDSNGNVQYDEYGNPIVSNWIQTNANIVSQQNTLGNNYTVYNIPETMSTFFGNINNISYNTYIYSRDYIKFNLIEFNFTSNGQLIYYPQTVYDQNGNLITFYITETGISNTWSLFVNNNNVGTLSYYNNQFSLNLSSSGSSYLTSLGFNINTINFSEINSNTVLQVLGNENIADIRLRQFRNIATIQLNNGLLTATMLNNTIYDSNLNAYTLTTSIDPNDNVSIIFSYVPAVNLNIQNPIPLFEVGPNLTLTGLNMYEIQNTFTNIGNITIIPVNNNTVTVQINGIMDHSSIGQLNYNTNKITFYQTFTPDPQQNSIFEIFPLVSSSGSSGSSGSSISSGSPATTTGFLETGVSGNASLYYIPNTVFNIGQIFETNFLNFIKITPINQYDNVGNLIGFHNDFNSQFSDYIEVNVETPQINFVQ